MKVLLKGGPCNGQIHDYRFNVFGHGHMEARYNAKTGEFLGGIEHYYEAHHEPAEVHPCKKRGKVKVFTYVGKRKHTKAPQRGRTIGGGPPLIRFKKWLKNDGKSAAVAA